jgi:hypothetical protein
VPTPATYHRARRGRHSLLAALLALLLAFAAATFTAAPARATTISPDSLGVNLRLLTVNHQLQPGDLAVGSAAGMGVARVPVDQGTNIDSWVALTAAAHVRLYPELGLPTAETPAAAAGDMAQFITSFAQRYGPGGSFWSQNPQLPYLPVHSFEIGNEPNMPLQWVADTTHLHWSDPAAYAQVYEASRAALHQVDPSGVAVVGGLGDSANGGVDLKSDERWLSALTPGAVDAVGYHPYTYDVSDSLMQIDTAALRVWMDANRLAGVPIDVNEFDACNVTSTTTDNSQCAKTQTSAEWGAVVASYTQWALCTPSLGVEDIQPFYWGGTATTDADVWMTIVTGAQALTPLGQDYLGQAQSLTTSGCPALPPQVMAGPTITGSATSGARLSASTGSWTGNPAPAISYQWVRCAATGQSCSNIAGATSAGYTLQPGDGGSTIRVAVTAANAAGTATVSSALTGPVGGSPAPATKTVTAPTKTVTAPTKTGSSKNGGTGSTKTASTTDKAATTSPGSSTGKPRATTAATKSTRLSPTRLRLVSIRRRGRHLDVTVRAGAGCTRVRVTAYGRRHRRISLRLTRHHRGQALTDFISKLSTGRWTVIVSAGATRGHAKPNQVQRKVTIRA